VSRQPPPPSPSPFRLDVWLCDDAPPLPPHPPSSCALQIRSSLLSLSTRDVGVIEAALATLLRMVPMRARAREESLGLFHEESIVPRVAHVLTSVAAGSFKGTAVIVSTATLVLYRMVYDDGAAACV
jgi:hypothetical protein